MLLSIVIPAYNASMYISACLHSIFDQVDQRVEVILVDDGSQDKTLEIILSDFGDHIGAGRLQVISQANSGPGAARNRGLDLCSGRYITDRKSVVRERVCFPV